MRAAPLPSPAMEEEDDFAPGQSSAVLVSLHFLVTSLRRRWRSCMAAALLGLLAAGAFLILVPPSVSAKTALVLAHLEGVDPGLAMATDLGLLKTRTVAAETVQQLGLAMTPDSFLKTVDAARVSPELMTITLQAPTGEEAVRRLSVFTSVYLDFRAEQLTRQSDVLIQGLRERMDGLQKDLTTLSQRIDRLSRTPASNSNELSDLIQQRTSISSKIEQLQQDVEDATLGKNSVVSASRVIDPAAVAPSGLKRRIVLLLATGLIGGLALGCGMVLFRSITSDRLHRRSEVADALGTTVGVSVGRIAPLPKLLTWLPHLGALNQRRTDERSRLTEAIVRELRTDGDPDRLAIGCVQNAHEVRFAVAEVAARLGENGYSVAVIDLSHDGCLRGRLLAKLSAAAGEPTVLRPLGIPQLAREASDLAIAGVWDADGAGWSQHADVTLILADLDPIVGADYLTAWSDRVVLAVSAGRSGADRLRSVAELVRRADLDMRPAALLRTERTDDSSGIGPAAGARLLPSPESDPEPGIEPRSSIR